MTNRKRTLLVVVVTVLAAALFLAGCSGGEAAPGEGASLEEQTQTVPVGDAGAYTDVSVEGLATMREEETFPLINVHIPYEGEIEGTDLFIPYNEIEQNLDQLPEDKDARIVLYCRSGSMSAQAARTLVELGYTDVWNVDGGMIAWENSGRPLLNR
ncbi:MAG TPA: rhodanese-like domain-containing protein [Candidatus Sulfomarinibacteraceae bacterium]|nr:rhodanese-like domain-containing protein [Candidatus Sulfomarinibacteraceae bacterium]